MADSGNVRARIEAGFVLRRADHHVAIRLRHEIASGAVDGMAYRRGQTAEGGDLAAHGIDRYHGVEPPAELLTPGARGDDHSVAGEMLAGRHGGRNPVVLSFEFDDRLALDDAYAAAR